MRIATANTDFAKRGDADYLTQLASNVDVILTQESKDTNLAKVAADLPRGPWTAIQDTTDPAHKGTGILVRDEAAHILHHELFLGAKPFLPTGRRVAMLTRYIQTAILEPADGSPKVFVASAHFPPHRFAGVQPAFLKNLQAVVANRPRVVVGTDANQDINKVAAALGFQAHGQGIVGLLTSDGVDVSGVSVRPWGVEHGYTDHPYVAANVVGLNRTPRPYAKTTERNGKTLDELTNYALFAVEKRLHYTPGSLTVVQGSYNPGGVGASAGTHDGGGAVDLTPQDWEKKVRALRAVGFAAWHRPAIPGLWGEHVHAVLIGNAKLSPAAAAQVVDYRNHRNGLADHGPDNTWHPDPIPTFQMPKWEASA